MLYTLAAATSCFPLCVDAKARTISLEVCQEHCSCVQKELRPRTFYFCCEMHKYLCVLEWDCLCLNEDKSLLL